MTSTTTKFNHFLEGNFAPVRIERDVPDLPITGTVPKELSGALYRVGPNPQYSPRDDNYHWFAGDGMAHAFFIDKSKVTYRNRWARTPKWNMENRAGQALFGTFGNPATSDPITAGQNTGTANTNVVWHGNRLFALEESHQPFELHYLTLKSKGHQSFGNKINARFTAHPRVDSQTGEMHFFAYSPDGPGTCGMLYGVLDRNCNVTRLLSFEAPYASMVHDFLMTKSHVLFPIMPLTTSIERAMRGKPLFAWEPEKHTHVGILRKGSPAKEMRWFETEACHVFHFMNAWEDDGTIIAYAMQSEIAPGLPDADGKPGDPAKMAARLCRWTFDLNGNGTRFKREYCDDLTGEFPRIDDRYCGLQNRYSWYVCHADNAIRAESESILYGSLACIDFKTGKRHLYTLPKGDVISEPVFVPFSPHADEGEGWLLAVAWRERTQRSDLLIFDAITIQSGPIAIAHLPCRVPFGFHGNWRASSLSQTNCA